MDKFVCKSSLAELLGMREFILAIGHSDTDTDTDTDVALFTLLRSLSPCFLSQAHR